MPARKFIYDRNGGGVVETTPPEVRSVCDAISKSVEPYREPLKFGGGRSKRSCATWPMTPLTIACGDAEGVRREQELLRKHGVATEYTKDFRPILTSPAHRKRHCEVLGLADKDAGYGDPAPKNYVESSHSLKVARKARAELQTEIRERIRQIEVQLKLRPGMA